MLGYIAELGLCAVEESFAPKSTRTDGYLGLYHIVASSTRIIFQPQQYAYAHLLMRLHHIVEHKVGRVEEREASYGKECYI